MKTLSIFFLLALVTLGLVCRSGAQGNSYNGYQSFTGSGAATNGSFTGTFTGNGGALTNLSGYNLVGQLILQNGVGLAIQTNGTFPFGNTNWSSITMPGTASASPTNYTTLTNSPYIQIYSGYPVAGLAFGYAPSLLAYVTNNQGPEIRFRIGVYGSQLGMYSQDGTIWYKSDGSVFSEVQLPSVGNNIYWTFTWPNFGRHTIEIHAVTGGTSGGVLGFYFRTTNALVTMPVPSQTGIIVGDSVCDGADGLIGDQCFPQQLQDLVESYGINIISQSEGATGYTVDGGSGGTRFINRLTNAIEAFKPNFVIWAGGINDSVTITNLFTAATNCFSLLKANQPNCKQLVIAGMPTGNTGAATAICQVLSNAAAATGLPVLCPSFTNSTCWIQGQYNIPGSGNAPLFIQSDNTHPTIPGAAFYAYQAANFVLTNLVVGATPILW